MTKPLFAMSDEERKACEKASHELVAKFLADIAALPYPLREFQADRVVRALRKMLRAEPKAAEEFDKGKAEHTRQWLGLCRD